MEVMEAVKKIEIVSLKMVKDGELYGEYNSISSPSYAEKIIRDFIGDRDREYAVVITIDTKNRPTSINVVSIGSLNVSLVYPREVFKTAILSNAASIIIGHNHPSGDPTQSQEDINITKRLKECGKLLGIELLDHIIIGDSSYISLRDKGLI